MGVEIQKENTFRFRTLLYQIIPQVPQRLCGPAGCGFVPGPEQCHDETKTVVTDLPSEDCDLIPQRKCEEGRVFGARS